MGSEVSVDKTFGDTYPRFTPQEICILPGPVAEAGLTSPLVQGQYMAWPGLASEDIVPLAILKVSGRATSRQSWDCGECDWEEKAENRQKAGSW